jgi:hypothetical protein
MSATAPAPKFTYNPNAPAWEPSTDAMSKVEAAMAVATEKIAAAALAGFTPIPVVQTETFAEMCAKIAAATDEHRAEVAAATAVAAAEAIAPRPKPIIIALDREVRLFPMKEPRTKGIDDVLGWLGMIVTNGDEDSVPKDFPKEKVYDYGCHYNDYRLESCLRPMPGFADPTPEELGDFPKNIQDYFWLDDGLKDEHPWRALCRLTTGLFVYVRASCTYSGFECMGGISIYAAKHPQTLVDHGMTEEDRRRFARIFNKHKGIIGSAKAPAGSAAKPFNAKAPLVPATGSGRQTTARIPASRPSTYPKPATVPKK